MKQKVLILGVAPVQLDAILELKKQGYETYACAMEKDGPGADAADFFEKINILNVGSITAFVEKNQISLIYSVGSDLAMPIACQISEKLGIPHFVSENTAKICNNKDLMRTTLGKDFNGNLKYQIIKNIDEDIELKYPFILKPTDSQGQRGIKLVENFKEYLQGFEIASKYSRSGLVILEQYISGPELSVNGYIIDGEIKLLIPSDRETWAQYTGLIHRHIVPSVNLNPEILDELKSIVETTCKKLGITNGPVYAQIKLEENKPYIIEITPRLDGCHMWNLLNYYSGVNLLKLTFEHLLNNNTSELEQKKESCKDAFVLEFICQKPNTDADFTKYKSSVENSLYSFNYYKQGDNIRPINGRLDKIGYFIDEN